jgi:hypothetical protein
MKPVELERDGVRITIDPQTYRSLVMSMVQNGAMERWEGWKLLFNAGWRGPALNAVTLL